MTTRSRHVFTYTCDRCGTSATAFDCELPAGAQPMAPSLPDAWVERREAATEGQGVKVEHFCSRLCEVDALAGVSADAVRGEAPLYPPPHCAPVMHTHRSPLDPRNV